MIIRNSVLCLECNEEIESTHRHDFKWCSCRSVAVDGGKDYLKRAIKDSAKIKDTSIVVDGKSWTGTDNLEDERGIGEGEY